MTPRGRRRLFRQAIDVQPEVEAAHRGLGLALREEGQLAEAFRELQTATQLNPRTPTPIALWARWPGR